MTPDPTGYIIRPGSPEAADLGLTPDRVGPETYLWRNGNLLWFTHLDILGLHPRKVLHDLAARTNARGLVAVIPQEGEAVDQELLEWGFVLRAFDCKDGRRILAYLRGPRGLPLVHACYEKFGVRVMITDETDDLGFTVRAEVHGTVVRVDASPEGIQTWTEGV
jgi:hypothetical protein